LEQVALVSDADTLGEEEQNAATLLTLHAAKGLEFPIVFITGLEEGVLPHSRSMEDMEELAEERRLFYVGLTRAKDRVYLLHTFRRTFYGEASVGTPSRFLGDIPEGLVTGGDTAQRRNESVARASSWSWDRDRAVPRRGNRGRYGSERDRPSRTTGNPFVRSRPHRPDRSDDDAKKKEETTNGGAPQYRTGQKVRHAKFGEGIVIESKVTGNDEEVTVAFKNEGLKKLAASFANLEEVGD
jgi:DNA helicase-2/ATP-dependent DNA helicase PcrA